MSNVTGQDAPARNAFAITPHDTNNLDPFTRALYVGGQGDVKVDTVAGDSAVVFVGVVGILPVQVARVYATGTDATDIVGLY